MCARSVDCHVDQRCTWGRYSGTRGSASDNATSCDNSLPHDVYSLACMETLTFSCRSAVCERARDSGACGSAPDSAAAARAASCVRAANSRRSLANASHAPSRRRRHASRASTRWDRSSNHYRQVVLLHE